MGSTVEQTSPRQELLVAPEAFSSGLEEFQTALEEFKTARMEFKTARMEFKTARMEFKAALEEFKAAQKEFPSTPDTPLIPRVYRTIAADRLNFA